MTIHEQKLRAMAKQVPMLATELVAAADEIERLNAAIETWGDVDLNKIKAGAVCELIEKSNSWIVENGKTRRTIFVSDAKNLLRKLEQEK